MDVQSEVNPYQSPGGETSKPAHANEDLRETRRIKLAWVGVFLLNWMGDNSCSLALGGGEGLNFVVRAHGLVRFLLGSSIEQAEATLIPT
jgi:hypothetical protein